jgi:energy-coupling factor transporter ATP-binding protein EcfA2
LELGLPTGETLVSDASLDIASGSRLLIQGPSGSGKSTLFRAIAGIWPFGRGRIHQPQDFRALFLPQRPYFPLGTLREVVLYPMASQACTDEQLMDIDLQLLDIKSGDAAVYQRVTNHPLQPTLDYARRLSDLGRPMWVRFVLVPGLTDDPANVETVADICAELGPALQRVEILRFHQMGKIKWEKLGLDYPLANVEPPSAELSERVRGQFRSRGLTVY